MVIKKINKTDQLKTNKNNNSELLTYMGLNMFYYVSKIIWFFIQPSGFLIFLSGIGMILLWTRWARTGRAAVTFGAVGLLIIALTPIGYLLLLPLEERFPRVDLRQLGGPPTGIIVLGGVSNSTISRDRNTFALNDRAERLTAAVELANRYPDAKIVFSGGSGSILVDAGEPEAISAGKFLVSMGVNENRIILEDRSRNTIENAQFSKDLLNPKPGERWLIITSAFHMPRSMGCFRSVGFEVYPWTVDYNTHGITDITKLPRLVSKGMLRTDIAVREWIGLVAYYATGKIPTLFPK